MCEFLKKKEKHLQKQYLNMAVEDTLIKHGAGIVVSRQNIEQIKAADGSTHLIQIISCLSSAIDNSRTGLDKTFAGLQ